MEDKRYSFVRRRAERPGLYVPRLAGRQRKRKRSPPAAEPRPTVRGRALRRPPPDVKVLANNYIATGEGYGDLKFLIEDHETQSRRRRRIPREWTPDVSADEDATSSSDSDDSDSDDSSDYIIRRRPVVHPSRNGPPPPPGAVLHTGPGPGEYEAHIPQPPQDGAPPAPPPPGATILHTGPGPGEFEVRIQDTAQRPPGAAGGASGHEFIVLGSVPGVRIPRHPTPPPGMPAAPRASGSERRDRRQRASDRRSSRNRGNAEGSGRAAPGRSSRASRNDRDRVYNDQRNAQGSGQTRHGHQFVQGSVLRVPGSSQGPKDVQIVFGYYKDGDFITYPRDFPDHLRYCSRRDDDNWLIETIVSEYRRINPFYFLSFKKLGFAHFIRLEPKSNVRHNYAVTSRVGIIDCVDDRAAEIANRFQHLVYHPPPKSERNLTLRLDEIVEKGYKHGLFIIVRLFERPNPFLYFVILGLAISASVIAAVVYSQYTSDIPTAFSIATYILTVFTVILAFVAIGDYLGLEKAHTAADFAYDIQTGTVETAQGSDDQFIKGALKAFPQRRHRGRYI